MLVHHPKVSIKRFGPPKKLEHFCNIDVWSMALLIDGARRTGDGPKPTTAEMQNAQVRLAVFTFDEYKERAEPTAFELVPFAAVRSDVTAAWERVYCRYFHIDNVDQF